jgi:type IV secretory pathway VirB9-like protein
MTQRFFRLQKRSLLSLLTLAGLFSPVLPAAATHAATDAATTVRVVKVAREDVVPVRAKVRYSTLLVLPDNEEILDFTTGDREFWIVNGAHNLCYVHPAQAGIRSNLNLITASGHVYSFLLFVEPKESSGATALQGYVRASEAEAYRKELQTLREQNETRVRAADAGVVEQINRFRSEYAGKLRFDYTLDANPRREPFLVSAIYHDDAFTYVHCAAQEKPALYEVKDGKPNLVPFQFENGVYIAPKIIDNGYLAVGKKKLVFARRTSGE